LCGNILDWEMVYIALILALNSTTPITTRPDVFGINVHWRSGSFACLNSDVVQSCNVLWIVIDRNTHTLSVPYVDAFGAGDVITLAMPIFEANAACVPINTNRRRSVLQTDTTVTSTSVVSNSTSGTAASTTQPSSLTTSGATTTTSSPITTTSTNVPTTTTTTTTTPPPPPPTSTSTSQAATTSTATSSGVTPSTTATSTPSPTPDTSNQCDRSADPILGVEGNNIRYMYFTFCKFRKIPKKKKKVWIFNIRTCTMCFSTSHRNVWTTTTNKRRVSHKTCRQVRRCATQIVRRVGRPTVASRVLSLIPVVIWFLLKHFVMLIIQVCFFWKQKLVCWICFFGFFLPMVQIVYQ